MIYPFVFQISELINLQNMSEMEIEEAIKIALKRLATELSRNGELVRFETKLQQRKQYDVMELEYIQNQRLRKELGNQYESSDSEEEKENVYQKMPRTQIKKMLRKKLIDKNFDEDVLEPLPQNQQTQQQNEQYITTMNIDELSSFETKQNELKSIRESKEVEDDDERETNFGLYFLIRELQKLQKARPSQISQSCRTGIAL